MCGIVGIYGDIDVKAERAFRTLLILDSLRGTDSTGAAIVNRGTNNDPTVVKAVGNPYELIDTKRFDNALKGVHRVMIGHNRYATQGKVNTRNVHPFEFDNVVGVHNGTVYNKFVLDGANEYDVDSQAIYSHINKHGVESAIANLNGAWALVWWQKDTSTLHMIRNKERPLYLCESKDGKQNFFASEAWMLTVALSRAEISHTTPYALREDTLVSCKIKPYGEVEEEIIKENVKSNYVAHTSSVFQNGRVFNNVSNTTQQQKTNVTELRPNISAVNSTYAGKKGRILRAMSFHKDANGGGYFQAFDKDFPSLNIRLYVNKGSIEMDWLGKDFIGDISEKPSYVEGKLFHKVVHCTTSLYIKKDVQVLEPPEEEKVDPDTFPDKAGNLINRKNWVKRYGNCCVCNGDVSPTGVFRFAKSCDEALCSVCMDDESIIQYMGL